MLSFAKDKGMTFLCVIPFLDWYKFFGNFGDLVEYCHKINGDLVEYYHEMNGDLR